MSLLFLSLVCALFVKAVAVDCPSGWLVHGNQCYHFSHDLEQWRVARTLCQDFGADLVEVLSRDVDSFLQQEINRLKADFWICGNDLEEEGKFVWVNSRTDVLNGYTNWYVNEPNNSAGNENCMDMRPGTTGWNDAACSALKHYVCSKEPGVDPELIG